MSDYRMGGEPGRIFPGGVELQSLPKRAIGAALVTAAAVGWLSLLTWSISDPSFNRAMKGAPSNLLGTVGASLADTLLQLLGLASITLFLPVAVWGLTIATGETLTGMRQRVVMWALAMGLIASALSIFPDPKGWVLTHGLGGIVGDFGQSFFLRFGGLLNTKYADIIGAIIAAYAGLWALVRACGIALTDLRLLWHLPPPGSPSRAAMASRVGSLAAVWQTLTRRIAEALDRDTRQGNWRRSDWRSDGMRTRRARRRTAEASYDARFNGYESEPERQVPVRPRPGPARQPAREQIHPESARVEPFFDATPSFPAPEPAHRLVRILPMHGQQSPAPSAAPTYHAMEAHQQRAPHAPEHLHQESHAAMDEQPRYAEQRAYAGGPHSTPQSYQEAAHAAQQHYGAAQHGYPASPPSQNYTAQLYAGDNGANYTWPSRESYGEPDRDQRMQAAPPRAATPSRHGVSNRALIVPPIDESDRFSNFKLPALRLLNPAPERRNNPELSDTALGRKAEMLHGVLEDFGIKGTINGVHPGPVITLFELEPARGTKSSRVIGLADDIARSMSAVSARVAVIPGRDAIGIELPNQNRETVFLRELLEAAEFAKGKAALPLALGKTISGTPVTVDLSRMPHLLIAGTTGSGKSVAINAMILSLLYRLTPEQCRFILIDPKMLELSVYDDIPHLLTPVVTDPRKAIAALKWTVGEMNVRYERMCKLGVRNITGFNQKVGRAKLQGRPLTRTVQTGFDDDGDAIYEREEIDDSPMPYIVVVIDEMADLMMVAGKDIEYAVQRLSQMARAAGIHLIMATQRPSVDVITGTIKANFPSRVSFQVTSKIDSRTILGEQGAEQLLGAGDMLSMAAGGRIMRAHGPFVSDEEVERVVEFLRDQAEPDYLDGLLDEDGPVDTKRAGSVENGGRELTGEALYDQAVDIIIKERRATTSYLQRRLGIGYNRAASLIERMEEEGLISAPNRTGKRDIRGAEAD
jgi:S-DNA-T family DNA segregation ATPase FtsK/SpoIIIE